MRNSLKIGTRGSPLALKQTEMTCALLVEAHPDLEIETVVIKTSGDWAPEDGEVRLQDRDGGKGQFAKEIEEALLAGEIDAAVHSMKDMDSNLPEGLSITHMLPREDPRDVLLLSNLAKNIQKISDISEDLKIGTASVRRHAFLLAKNPALNIEPLRGNVGTRIEKLRAGQVDVTLLALAGLKRLGLEQEADVVLEPEDMLPAAGQGAVGIEMREGDQDIAALFEPISCKKTVLCVSSERAALKILDGSCHTPIGAYAVLEGQEIHLRLLVAALDGSESYEDEVRGEVNDVEGVITLGRDLAQSLKSRIPAYILQQKAA